MKWSENGTWSHLIKKIIQKNTEHNIVKNETKLMKHSGDNTVAGKRERRKGDKNAYTEEPVLNRPFARSGLMVQRNSYQSSPTFLCFESPTASFASQHNLFRTM